MRNRTRILVSAGCILLLLASWVIVICSKSEAERQLELICQATALMNKGIYVRAVPLLEEAAGYGAAHTMAAETELKRAYLALIGNRGVNRKYTALLEKQMGRRNALPDVFAEAADYYLGTSKVAEALEALRAGIERTGDGRLESMYEDSRYAYKINRSPYDYVSAIDGWTVQVQKDGLWGIAEADGVPMIPCEYEKISTYSDDRAIVRKGGETYAVDSGNNRIELLSEAADDFGNLSDDRVPLLIGGRWLRAAGDFTLGDVEYEGIGTYSGGFAAAKTGGKWGVVDLGVKWLLPAEFDEIIQDELGRCYAQGAVFARSGANVFLIKGGQEVAGVYEDARPFSEEGYAAVKRGGRWGFVDSNGDAAIGFVFDDALSFGQHLAAVKQGELWGYASLSGKVVIEPTFLEAKSFSNGSAPVLTERGWEFITLLEYKKEVGL